MAENIVEISSLTKRYEGKTALQNVSIALPKGRIVGLLGPNGAGKTNWMKVYRRSF